MDIASKFNNYFINIGPSLAEKIPSVPGTHLQYLKRNSNSIFIKPTSSEEVISIANNLQVNKGSGFDDLSPKVVKGVIHMLAPVLTNIFNRSIEQGCFPDQMKVAKVTPIYKSDDKLAVTNYRPISVLPVLSKILEKIMYLRLTEFITANQLLSDKQYGFRENHSTALALLDLTDKISRQIDEKKHSLGIFIDLSKAFDTLDHHILIRKLEYLGIRGLALQWFESYLSNRTQFVNINKTASARLFIRCGVPQGSILGPLLFILYINDITNVSTDVYLIMFADDTNIFLHDKDIQHLENKANSELNKFSDWFKLNKLSINVKKTHYILFRSKLNKTATELKIAVNGTVIESCRSTKFLGVIINQHLTWSDHVSVLKLKVSKNLGVIKKIRHNLTSESLKSLYYALIYPYISYCNIVWAHHSSSVAELQILQKRQSA